jgi:hypothetical protein
MVRLLRPGFHSGTLPKLYARLRRADRKAYWTGNWKSSRKYREAIQHVEHAIRSLIERELIAILSQSRRFGAQELQLGRLKTGASSVRFELRCEDRGEASFWVALNEQSGWLTASVIQPGWSAALNEAEQQALADALTGFYKIAGVELIREQIESALPTAASYEPCEGGLKIWFEQGGAPIVYDLRDSGSAAINVPGLNGEPEELDREQLAFFVLPVTWELWVEVWDRDQTGGRYAPRLVIGANLLPWPRTAVQPL